MALEQKQLQLKAMLLNAQSAMLQSGAILAGSNISAAVRENGQKAAARWESELDSSIAQFKEDLVAAAGG